jgi:hypothetical protein
MDWPMLLACITGLVEEHLLLRYKYLAAENAILRNQIKGRLHLRDAERVVFQKWTFGPVYGMLRPSSQGGPDGTRFRALSPLSKRSRH